MAVKMGDEQIEVVGSTEQALESSEEMTEEKAASIVRDWVKICNTVSILAAGKTGVGKSTLLNAISGEVFFRSSKDRSQAGTKIIESYSFQRHGVTITAWDSPGFQDNSGNEEVYKRELKKHCRDVDLLLYCISLKEIRADLGTDGSAFKQITEALTKDIWKRCIVVLTFSNVMERRLRTKRVQNLEESFNVKVVQWKVKVQEAMREAGVEEAVIEKVSVIPAGHCKQRHLPGYQNWLSNVWSTCVRVTSEEAAVALSRVNKHRLKREHEVNSDDFKKEGHEQPIIIPSTTVVAGTALLGTAIGATTGALIGALAIGIPTFGVAAGVGLGLGLVLGGAIGAGAGGSLIMLAKKIRKKKKNKKREEEHETEP